MFLSRKENFAGRATPNFCSTWSMYASTEAVNWTMFGSLILYSDDHVHAMSIMNTEMIEDDQMRDSLSLEREIGSPRSFFFVF